MVTTSNPTPGPYLFGINAGTENGLVTGVDFVYVQTEDIDRAVDFYGNVLGLPELKRYGRMPGVEFQADNLTIAVIQSSAFGFDFNASKSQIAFRVDDVEAARAELEAKGVSFGADTLDSGVCHMAFFEDPDGNALMLHNRYAPPGAHPPGLDD